MNNLSFFATIVALFIFAHTNAQTTTVTLDPTADNTLYESVTGSLSNGLGNHLFSGYTAGALIRRAVLKFDVSSIPAGATITSAEIQLRMNKTIVGDVNNSFHRLNKDWGEGTSDATGQEGMGTAATTGDATWVHTFFNSSNWTNMGGDFVATASASQTVGLTTGFYTWTGSNLTSDVQDMLDNPAGNFGWILLGPEGGSTTAKRYNSVQSVNTANRPKLTITYTMPISCAIPQNLTALNPVSAGSGKSKINLSWDPVGSAVNYTVRGGLIGTNPANYTVLTVGGPFTATGLSETTYVWQVRTNCQGDSSAYATLDTFTIAPCVTPINIMTTVSGSSSTFSWDAVPAAIGYVFEAGTNPGTFSFQQILSGGSNTSLTLNSIPSGSYKWRVQAGCNVSPLRLSPFSASQLFVIPESTSKGFSQSDNFTIYPNPVESFLKVEGDFNADEMRIINVLGKELYHSKFYREVDVEKLSPGIYFLELNAGDRRDSRLFIKN